MSVIQQSKYKLDLKENKNSLPKNLFNFLVDISETLIDDFQTLLLF